MKLLYVLCLLAFSFQAQARDIRFPNGLMIAVIPDEKTQLNDIMVCHNGTRTDCDERLGTRQYSNQEITQLINKINSSGDIQNQRAEDSLKYACGIVGVVTAATGGALVLGGIVGCVMGGAASWFLLDNLTKTDDDTTVKEGLRPSSGQHSQKSNDIFGVPFTSLRTAILTHLPQ
ncbi:MAG: hypothetical protein AB7F59_07225 [Bdellovibrionales bacterium]